MVVDSQAVCQITDSVWTSTLNLPVQPVAAPNDKAAPGRSMVGCVQITGTWSGAVTLECASALARRCAASMFGMDPEMASEAEIKDALGELTNMVGGNIKSLIEGPCQLSLPTITEGQDFSFSIPGTREILRNHFVCEESLFLVRVLERV